jgi:hypothetical protein
MIVAVPPRNALAALLDEGGGILAKARVEADVGALGEVHACGRAEGLGDGEVALAEGKGAQVRVEDGVCATVEVSECGTQIGERRAPPNRFRVRILPVTAEKMGASGSSSASASDEIEGAEEGVERTWAKSRT